MFLLDTNLLSELRSEKRCHPKVKAWQQRTSLASCWISVVNLLEIRQEIGQVERSDKAFATILNGWLENQVKRSFAGKIVSISPEIAERAGRISAERTRGLADCLIAATALERRLILVTRNVGDFEDVNGLKIVNPWAE
jgi:predicted nucleic acid-binding protein